MPTYAEPFFLDGTSLVDSTSVYTNSGLSIPAPDGYYSDGLNIRRLVGGVLEPVQPCPTCGESCRDGFSFGSGGQGLYVAQIDTGSLPSSVGAIVITFDPFSVPDGIQAELDGVIYNELSSQAFGYIAGTSGLPTFTGNIANDCGLNGNTTVVSLPVYNREGGTFVATGATETVTITPGQVVLSPSDPGYCKMVIPKLSASPSTLTLKFYGACSGTEFQYEVKCPAALDKFKASVRFITIEPEDPIFCDAAISQNYFVARVGNATAPYLGLYDMVFTDSFGQNKMPDGYYRTNFVEAPNDGIQVQNGVIIAILDACL